MPGPGRELQLRLYRDSLSTPWGFRLHGGKDLRAPLTVQKVAVGSPVFGELQRDDVIMEIQSCDASQMTHKQAQDLIRNAGGSLLVRIHRYGRQEASPMSTSAHLDGAAVQRGFMLGRLKDTLTNALTEPSSSDYGDYYSPTSSTSVESVGPVKTWNLPKPAGKPQALMAGPLMEPGWTPECLRHPRRAGGQFGGGGPRGQPAAPAQQQHRSHHQQYPTAPAAHHSRYQAPAQAAPPEPPAWIGSLRHSTDSRPSDQRIGAGAVSPELTHYGPHQAAPGAGSSNDTLVVAAPPGVANLQYNTPVGLYSRSNVLEALSGQTAALNLGPSSSGGRQHQESDVLQLIKDEEVRHRHHQLHAASPPHSNDAAAAAARQSPSVRVLEQRFLHHHHAAAPGDAGVGMSDF